MARGIDFFSWNFWTHFLQESSNYLWATVQYTWVIHCISLIIADGFPPKLNIVECVSQVEVIISYTVEKSAQFRQTGWNILIEQSVYANTAVILEQNTLILQHVGSLSMSDATIKIIS